MSAIAGIFYLDRKPVEQNHLTKMLDILEHRGSDGANIWFEGNVGFIHRMLWTTPESLHETLPLEKGNLVITADARIDNRDELISALELNYLPKEKITDSDLILTAYQKWGEECPDKLLGDFAFAIWDKREQTLFCARDPMGVKPFYYYRYGNLFVFASEIKALFCLPEVPCELNELMVAYHLTRFFEDKAITFYKNILRLPSANTLTINTSNTKLRQYWSLNPSKEIKLSSDKEYAEAFHEIFTEAVRCRLRSAFPVGSTLSGGMDSSSITCTARQILNQSGNQPLHTFSAIFPSLPKEHLRWIDERPYMDTVKTLEGIKAHNVYADELNPLFDELWQEEEVALGANLYIHWGLYNSAHQQGVRVFLDGIDGDVTVGHGWFYLTELFYQLHWLKLAKEIAAAAKNSRLSRKRILVNQALRPLIQEAANYFKQTLNEILLIPPTENNLISQAFAQKVRLAQHTHKLLRDKPKMAITTRQGQFSGLSSGLYSYVFSITDRATAKVSLEARYPFCDRRLMEFCLALPSNQKFRQGWPRAVLRFAMNEILPPKIQWRVSKGNLFSSFQRQLLNNEKQTMKQLVEQPTNIEQYINLPALHKAYENYVFSPYDSGEDSINILAIINLAKWLNYINFIS